MFGWIAAAVIAVVTLVGGPSEPDWTKVYTKVNAASAPMIAYTPKGTTRIVCTMVSVEGWLTTARHCFPDDPVTEGIPAAPWGAFDGTYIASVGDFVVIGRAPEDMPTLKLRRSVVKTGEHVASVGHGWGTEEPSITMGHAQGFLNHVVGDWWLYPIEMVWWYSSDALLGGQSGGAVVDSEGRYITHVSFRDSHHPAAWLAGATSPDEVRRVLDELDADLD